MKPGFKRPFITLLISMMLVGFLPLLLNNLFYLRFRNTVMEQQTDLAEASMQFILQRVDSVQQSLIAVSTEMEAELREVPAISEENIDNEIRMEIYYLRATLGQKITKSLDSVYSIYLFFPDAQGGAGDFGWKNADEIFIRHYNGLGISRQAMDELHQTASRGKLVALDSDSTAFIYTVSRNQDGLPAKQAVFLINRRLFSNMLSEVNPEGGIFLLSDKAGNILAASNNGEIELEEEVQRELLESTAGADVRLQGQTFRICRLKSTVGNLQMTAAIPTAHLLEANRSLQWYYWSLMGASVILGLALAVFFSRRNMIPLNQLIAYIRENFGEKHPDSQGLEQIKDAIDALLEQQNADQKRLIHFETLAILSELRESFRGNAQIGRTFQLPPGCRYVIVRFSDPQASQELMEREIVESLEALPQGVIRYSISLDNTVAEILGMSSPDFDEEKVQELLTLQIGWLDQQGKLTVRAAFSRVYSEPQELERAYEEACVAEACSAEDKEAVLMSFSSCKFQASRLLRDWHHLDKQLQFSYLLADEEFEEAVELLPELFPMEFLEELFSESDISRLHLDSLKYQFLHDLDNIRKLGILSDEAWDSFFQRILYCKTHRKLYQLMDDLCTSLKAAEQETAEEVLDDKSVDKVKHYIRRHYADPQLSVSSIAEAFGVSANGLSQMFSRKSDRGVLDYIHEMRMKKAGEMLLAHRDLTIQNIAEQVGYTNILTFNRKFKSYYGKTAGEYRKLSEENSSEKKGSKKEG